jgi:hypothetical protein
VSTFKSKHVVYHKVLDPRGVGGQSCNSSRGTCISRLVVSWRHAIVVYITCNIRVAEAARRVSAAQLVCGQVPHMWSVTSEALCDRFCRVKPAVAIYRLACVPTAQHGIFAVAIWSYLAVGCCFKVHGRVVVGSFRVVGGTQIVVLRHPISGMHTVLTRAFACRAVTAAGYHQGVGSVVVRSMPYSLCHVTYGAGGDNEYRCAVGKNGPMEPGLSRVSHGATLGPAAKVE